MVAVAHNKYVDDVRGIVVEAVGCVDKCIQCLGCIYDDKVHDCCAKPETVPDCIDKDEVKNFIFIKKGVIK